MYWLGMDLKAFQVFLIGLFGGSQLNKMASTGVSHITLWCVGGIEIQCHHDANNVMSQVPFYNWCSERLVQMDDVCVFVYI